MASEASSFFDRDNSFINPYTGPRPGMTGVLSGSRSVEELHLPNLRQNSRKEVEEEGYAPKLSIH